ncbi:MAG: dihydropteroate synthase [Firmicutes bacterium]|nr:dihydropteroate synthase [Bacillota bacterium]
MIIGTKTFDTRNHAYLMGILNVTPDSFFDGGRFCDLDAAIYRAEQMIAQGADIIDVGGQSTRPGFTEVPVTEEIARVVPVIEAIKARFDIPVSCDTYRSEVAQAAIQVGADMINDVTSLSDNRMALVIAVAGVACVITPRELGNGDSDKRRQSPFITWELAWQTGAVPICQKAGIALDKVILDPGIGFGKTVEQNLWCLANLERFRRVGEGIGSCEFPLLVGASNKSFIGAALGVPEGERLYGTLAITAIAVLNGASFIRVHDIKANKQVIAMTEAIQNAENRNEY